MGSADPSGKSSPISISHSISLIVWTLAIASARKASLLKVGVMMDKEITKPAPDPHTSAEAMDEFA